MCCFSIAGVPVGLLRRLLPAVRVTATNIFARMLSPTEQGLAYSMTLATDLELAMILPLPVVPGSGDDAVRFVDLSAHAAMFVELSQLFVEPQRKGGISLFQRKPTLAVHTVGNFIASYVPTRADFARVDARFRMPDAAFDAVPAYADYGFAVFQLAAGDHAIHPMGLAFPTRDPARLFFPTVHVHDGVARARAKFDHALYYQASTPVDSQSWDTPATDYVGLVDRAARVARRTIRGRHANADTWIG